MNDEVGEACSMHDIHKMLVGKPEGKRPLGRPRQRCEDIKMN